MMFRNATAAVMVLAVTTAMAQGISPATVPGGGPIMSPNHGFAGRRGMPPAARNKMSGLPAPPALHQRIQDMESTLDQMHLVLKQMQAKAAKSSAKDSLAKANLEMWGLLVGHLDKQLQELKLAEAAREDMEARRAALYKQADAKAEASAAAARAAQAAQAAQAAGSFSAGQAQTPTPAAQGPGQGPSGQTPSPASASPSPN